MAHSVSAGGFETGLTNDLVFEFANEGTRTFWFDRTSDARANFVLLGANWQGIAPAQPPKGFDPTDPADPAYRWEALDEAVRAAGTRGLDVVILVTSAPDWAEGPGRPNIVEAPPGTWLPDASQLHQFAIAISKRYSGRFADLPRVSYWQAWADPNLWVHLTPQFEGGQPVAAMHYRGMLNAFYAGIKSVSPTDQVITGGTAPYGDPPGGERTSPALFWRTLLCLNGQRLRPAPCSDPAHFDIAAHNPIDASGPNVGAQNIDDISTPDLGRLKRILSRARRTGRSQPAGRKPLWATEFWWDSNPPDPNGVSVQTQAHWLEQALYLFWKQGVKRAVWSLISDEPPVPDYASTYQTGLFQLDGTPKLAFQAFRFPFVTDRLNRQKIRVWGMAPSAGGVRIQRRVHGQWKTARRLRAGRDRVFSGGLNLRGHARLRAATAGETSLIWRQH